MAVSRAGLRLPYNRQAGQQVRTQATLQQIGQSAGKDSGYPTAERAGLRLPCKIYAGQKAGLRLPYNTQSVKKTGLRLPC